MKRPIPDCFIGVFCKLTQRTGNLRVGAELSETRRDRRTDAATRIRCGPQQRRNTYSIGLMPQRRCSGFTNSFALIFNQTTFNQWNGLLLKREVRRAKLAEKKHGDLSASNL